MPNEHLTQLLCAALEHPKQAEGYIRQVIEMMTADSRPIGEARLDALAEKVNANVGRMETSQKIDPETWNLQVGEAGAREWLPIESAPRDGTPVLLTWHWDSGIHTGIGVVLARWGCRKHRHLSSLHDCPNETDCDMQWDNYAGVMSHWMPLPDPPADSQHGGDEK